jgi:hypothetical protein
MQEKEMAIYRNRITGTIGTIDQIVSELTTYTLRLTSDRDVDHIVDVVEGSEDDAYAAGLGIDSGHGTPDDVEIIARRPATIDDVQDKDAAHLEIACLAEADPEDAAYYAGVKRRSEMLAEIAASDAEYVTYGDGDLGVPVLRADAMDDIASMDPLSIGDGTWYPCAGPVSNEAREIVERGLYDAAAGLMDDDLRERLHAELAPCSDAAFLAAYMAAHLEVYGEPFVVE